MALPITHKKPTLSSSAFWDTDLSRLDFDRYADFVIIRVFERGTEKDVEEILAYYGRPHAMSSLSQAHSLTLRAMALGEKLLGISPHQYTCSKRTPRAMNYSMY